jgi:hypothetical protein
MKGFVWIILLGLIIATGIFCCNREEIDRKAADLQAYQNSSILESLK